MIHMGTRKTLGLTQTEMAQRMGLSLSPYQTLEMDPDKLRKRHKMLAEYVALEEAVAKENLLLAPLAIRRLATKLSAMVQDDE
jgi:DNA-binding XRE family transcriptional regulator